MSFRVNSYHKFLKNPEPPAPTTYFDSNNKTSTYSKTNKVISKPETNTDTEVKTGSEGGMAMRTSQTGMEDYY